MIMQYGGFRLLNNSKLDQKFRRGIDSNLHIGRCNNLTIQKYLVANFYKGLLGGELLGGLWGGLVGLQ